MLNGPNDRQFDRTGQVVSHWMGFYRMKHVRAYK